jgi:hypothetical protein
MRIPCVLLTQYALMQIHAFNSIPVYKQGLLQHQVITLVMICAVQWIKQVPSLRCIMMRTVITGIHQHPLCVFRYLAWLYSSRWNTTDLDASSQRLLIAILYDCARA